MMMTATIKVVQLFFVFLCQACVVDSSDNNHDGDSCDISFHDDNDDSDVVVVTTMTMMIKVV